MDAKTIKEYIRSLEHMTAYFRTLLDDELRMPSTYISETDAISEATEIRFMIKSNAWPFSVPPEWICGENQNEKLERANGILHDSIKTDLTDKKFLDFGCGEGHVAFAANTLVEANTVGYDIQLHKWEFEQTDRLKFTDNFEEVKKNGPYDVILANDVIDHCENPQEAMDQIYSVLKPVTGRAYIKFHPWTSRHGGHLYRELNKAYAHLVMEEEELQVLGVIPEFTRKIYNPVQEYKNLISNSNFNVLDEEFVTAPLEMFFFQKDQILRRIKSKFEKENQTFSRDILEIQFVNYILGSK